MHMKTVITVGVSAERSWTIIAEQFANAAEWASSMSSSRLDQEELDVGATRIGKVGKREMRERVTALDRERRIFSYELIDPPPLVHAATNTWTIAEAGPDRSEIESELDLSLHWVLTPFSPIIRAGLKKQLTSASEEFQTFAETGTPHQRTIDKGTN